METIGSELQPLHDQIIFQFMEDTTQGRFNSKTSSGILIVDQNDKQVDFNRWGKIIDIGPNVTDFECGDMILIEKLCWTNSFILPSGRYWVTNQPSVLATWDDPDNLPSEVA